MRMADESRWRVLAVDDEEHQQRLLKDIFLFGPCALTVVPTGQALLDLAWTEPPHLFLLDIRMPGMDGVEVLRRLRADPRTAPVPAIAVTANAGPDERFAYEATGFVTCIAKPYDIVELVRVVHQILADDGGTDA